MKVGHAIGVSVRTITVALDRAEEGGADERGSLHETVLLNDGILPIVDEGGADGTGDEVDDDAVYVQAEERRIVGSADGAGFVVSPWTATRLQP